MWDFAREDRHGKRGWHMRKLRGVRDLESISISNVINLL